MYQSAVLMDFDRSVNRRQPHRLHPAPDLHTLPALGFLTGSDLGRYGSGRHLQVR
jgi:hypothetical protein